MKAEYQDNPKAGPGNGLLLLSGAIFPENPWAIAIQRGSDKYYLSGKTQNAWTGETVFLPVQGAARPDGSLVLELPPDIVNELDQQEQYAVALQGAGETRRARLRITGITYSQGGRLGITPDAPEHSGPQQSPPPPAGIEPDISPTPPESAPARQAGSPGARTPADNLPDLPDQKPASRKTWRWLLLAVLILACLAWYWLDPRSKNYQDSSEVPQRQQTQSPASRPKSVKEKVDEFFRAARTAPDQAMRLASQIQANSPDEQDALYRLYYFAAENGEQSAFLPYARALDPSLPKWGSIEKNGAEAWNFYSKSSDPKALEMKKNLRSWIESQAASGNTRAREWLKQIG